MYALVRLETMELLLYCAYRKREVRGKTLQNRKQALRFRIDIILSEDGSNVGTERAGETFHGACTIIVGG